MHFGLDLPDPLVKKIRALNILQDRDPRLIEETLVELIDAGVTAQGVAAFGGAQPAYQVAPVAVPALRPGGRMPVFARGSDAPLGDDVLSGEDVSGISDGLGDPDDTDPPVKTTRDPEAMIPARGGIKEELLDRDERVRDPEHEAKMGARGTTGGAMVQGTVSETPAEFEFAAIVGVEHPPLPPEEKRPGRRKPPKAVVHPATHVQSSF